MATMYVHGIPSNETVRLRQTPSTNGTTLINVGYGNAVEASASSTSRWHNASYGGYNGYMMSQYLTTTNPNGGGGSSTPLGQGTVTGGALNCRKQPQSGATAWGAIPKCYVYSDLYLLD